MMEKKDPMQNLRLTRPLAVFDLETTGIDVEKDRIVQVAVVRVEPDGQRRTYETLVNPERPIPPEATRVHGIKDSDVAGQPTFSLIRQELEEMLEGADLAGFNSIRFDTPLLQNELHRSGSSLDLGLAKQVDAMRIFHSMEPRNLSAAMQFYCGQELVDAHSALADTQATLEILDAQVARYDDLPDDVEALHRFCNPDEGRFVDRTGKFAWTESGEAAFTFGKLKGQTLQQAVQGDGRGYLEWMLGKDFSEEVKDILRNALSGVFPRK
jgi:DNA polymerase-3 subunit epsilon